jgi:hypothetical protein
VSVRDRQGHIEMLTRSRARSLKRGPAGVDLDQEGTPETEESRDLGQLPILITREKRNEEEGARSGRRGFQCLTCCPSAPVTIT